MGDIFKKISKKFRKFLYFSKILKNTIFAKDGPKNTFLAKFCQKGSSGVKAPDFFKVSAASAPKLDFFGRLQRAKCGIHPSPPLGPHHQEYL